MRKNSIIKNGIKIDGDLYLSGITSSTSLTKVLLYDESSKKIHYGDIDTGDVYGNWKINVNSDSYLDVISGYELTLQEDGATSITRVDGTITISSTDTNNYISNVGLIGNNLSFTGVGSAFNNNIDLSQYVNTNYSLSIPDTTTTIRLSGSDSSSSDIELSGGTNITITRDSINKITISGTNDYTLPLSTNSIRGGIQIGYVANGSNIPLELSSEKAYISITKSAIDSVISYEPPITKSSGYLTWNGTDWDFKNETYLTSYTETDPIFTTWTDTSRNQYFVFAAPNLSNGTPDWRRLTYTDIDNTPTIGDGTLSKSSITAGSTNTTVDLVFTGFNANSSTDNTINTIVGPALTNLASYMTGTGNIGFIKKTSSDTYTVDTNTYLTEVTPHNLLSSTHSDTTNNTVSRGSIITGQGTSPTWSMLSFPTSPNGKVLMANTTDVVWSTDPLGSAAYVNTGTSEGQLPLLITGGKLPESVIPKIALTEVYNVADDIERDTLVTTPGVQEGDVVIVNSSAEQSGEPATYIYNSSGNWLLLKTPTTGDDYGYWQIRANTGTYQNITSNYQLTLQQGGATTISRTDGTITISSTDTNTWQANTNTQEGYVSSGSGQFNKVWKTDGSGVPSWRDDLNTATAADNILEGSNNGTEITYAPYSIKQSSLLHFYTGTSNPDNTTRLNLDGYLYATQLYDNGNRVLTSYTETDPIFTTWRDTSRTQYHVFAAPNSSSGVPNWRRLSYSDIDNTPTIGNGTLTSTSVSNGLTNTTVDLNFSTTYSANTTTNTTINTVVGPSLTNLATTMTGAGNGFLIKSGQDTFTLDTNTYLTSAVTTISFGSTGLTPNTPTSGEIVVGGTLSVGNGGTGASTLTGILVGNGTSSITAITGTSNQLLRRNAGNTEYEFFTPSYLTSNENITWTASNDVSGTDNGTTSISPSLTVVGLRGKSLPSLNTTGGLLRYTGTGGTDIWEFDTNTYATTSQLHTRSHTMTSTDDHTAGNWKLFYSNGSGNITELSLGTNGQYLKSNGTSIAPSWDDITITTTLSDLTDTTINSPSDGQILIYSGSTNKWVNVDRETGESTLVAGTGISIVEDSGTVTISATGGGGTTSPGDPDMSIQFNNNGIFSGSTLYYDDSLNTYGINTSPTNDSIISFKMSDSYNTDKDIISFYHEYDNTLNKTFSIKHKYDNSIIFEHDTHGFGAGTFLQLIGKNSPIVLSSNNGFLFNSNVDYDNSPIYVDEGSIIYQNGYFENDKLSSYHKNILYNILTTNDTITELGLIKSFYGSSNNLTFNIKVLAIEDYGNTGSFFFEGVVSKKSSMSLNFVGTPNKTFYIENNLDGIDCTLSLNTVVPYGVKINVVGLPSKNIRWVAHVDVTSAAWTTW